MDFGVVDQNAAIADYIVGDIGAVVYDAVVPYVAGDNLGVRNAGEEVEVMVFQRYLLETTDSHETRKKSVMYKFGREGVGDEDEGPVAASIVVSDEGFQFEGFEASVSIQILARSFELFVADPIFILSRKEIMGGDEACADLHVAAYSYIVVHWGKYQAFQGRVQAGTSQLS